MALSQTLPGNQQTDLVTFSLKVNGESLSTQYQVASVLVSKEVNKIPFAKLVIYDGDPAAQDFAVSNEETFIPGAEIEILAGYHSDEATIFKGIILKHSLKIRNNRSPGTYTRLPR
jgi:phage protein D